MSSAELAKAVEFVTAWRDDANGLQLPDTEWGTWLAQAIDTLLEAVTRAPGERTTGETRDEYRVKWDDSLHRHGQVSAATDSLEALHRRYTADELARTGGYVEHRTVADTPWERFDLGVVLVAAPGPAVLLAEWGQQARDRVAHLDAIRRERGWLTANQERERTLSEGCAAAYGAALDLVSGAVI